MASSALGEHRVSRYANWIAKAWVAVGALVAAAVILELGYRIEQNAVGHLDASGRRITVAHPSAREAWYADFLDEQSAALRRREWRPFVYHRQQPFTGRYVNVDERGLRRTFNASPSDSTARPVFLFGGAATWGVGQRDSATVASQLAILLARDGVTNVRVVNLGQPGYVFTQEVIELAQLLQQGARPALVVFLDGVDDVTAAVETRMTGVPADEAERALEYQVGRELFDWRTSFAVEGRALATLASLAANRLESVKRLRTRRGESLPAFDDSLATDAATSHVATIRLVESMSKAYGFPVRFFWQPTLDATAKTLTPFERQLMDRRDEDARAESRLHARVTRLIVHSAATATAHFTDLSALFQHDSSPVFTDAASNLTETGSAMVAIQIARDIEPALRLDPRRQSSILPRRTTAPRSFNSHSDDYYATKASASPSSRPHRSGAPPCRLLERRLELAHRCARG